MLVFFPLAFTGVCQGELTELAERVDEFPPDTTVLAVSVDSLFALRAWTEQRGFPFPLLSDFWPHGQVARAYGVFDDEKGVARRGTFIIDGDGVIGWSIVTPITTPREVGEYLKVLA